MEKKVMNTRLAVAAVVLLFGLLLAGQEAAAAGYGDLAGPATEKAAAPTTDADAPATDAAEAPTPTPPPSGKKTRASYGKARYSKGDCEVPGTCDVKLAAAADPTRPGAVANEYTRGCSKIDKCRG